MPPYRSMLVGISLALAATLAGCDRAAPPAVPAASSSPQDGERAQADAAAAAAAFYAAHLRAYADGSVSGLPQGERMASYRPLLTRALLQRLERAQRLQTAFIAAHPDEKPPLIEGDAFSSAYQDEWIGAYAPGASSATGADSARVTIALTGAYPPGVDGPARRWTDAALMRREDGTWKLDDIEFDVEGSALPHERLSRVLDEAFP